MIEFEIQGEPKGKERPRFTKSGHTYTPKTTRSYERLISSTAQSEAIKLGYIKPAPDSALRIEISALMPIRDSWTRKKKIKALLGEISPTSKPDLDNIAKTICDALNGILYDDDKQITEMVLKKTFVIPEQTKTIIKLSKVKHD